MTKSIWKFKKESKVMDLLLGNNVSVLNERATMILVKKIVVITGWWNEFWNLLIFSKDGINNPICTDQTIKRISNNIKGLVEYLKYGKNMPF